MKDTKILLGITGGIAAYKVADLCRIFKKAGASVQVVMSESATEFITPLTMETLSENPVHIKMFDRGSPGVAHIELADTADLFVIAPATADFLARAAAGRAADLLSAVTLAYTGPVIAAPAMNTNMWNNPATQRNLHTLEESHGWTIVPPGTGELACGWTGPGRMAEPDEIFETVRCMHARDLDGLTFLVTAGPTVEDLDPVRFFSNRSSGKMGYAVARAAALRGAKVVLVSGPTSLAPPRGVTFVPVRSALEMERAVSEQASEADAVVMTAAVADFRPTEQSDKKLKKGANEKERVVRLTRNPDILAGLGKRFKNESRPILVGFALETEDLRTAAKKKLEKKGANLIVANLAADGFAGDDNEALIVDDRGNEESTGRISKRDLASLIVNLIKERTAR